MELVAFAYNRVGMQHSSVRMTLRKHIDVDD